MDQESKNQYPFTSDKDISDSLYCQNEQMTPDPVLIFTHF